MMTAGFGWGRVRLMTALRTMAVAVACIAGGAALALAFQSAREEEPRPSPVASAPDPRVPRNQGEIALSFAPVARAAQPAVVNIFTARVVRDRARMDGFFAFHSNQPRVENSLGSGVIVDPAGFIVTNAHVVRGADEITVALADRREYPARLVFADARLDLALLRVEPGAQPLPALALGDSDRAQVGDLVLAIGNPLGVGQTVTQGIVSATARTGLGISDTQFFLQTDAAINQGNSGGALVNLRGELIGVNTAILTAGREGGNIGLGFAVPSNMVRVFLQSARTGKVVTAWLGVEGESLTPETAAAAGLERPTGVLVNGVAPGSPAARAGLRPGDIIVALDGKEVQDPGTLRYRIATSGLGTEAELSVRRDGRTVALAVPLAAPPELPPRDLTTLPTGTILGGITVANLSPALAQELGAGLPERGVVVVAVPDNAPARVTGFPQPGDVIEAIDGQPVRSTDDVRRQTATPAPRTELLLARSSQRALCVFQAPRSWGCRTA
jgi:serine protease Do